jgi:hypothetical protein
MAISIRPMKDFSDGWFVTLVKGLILRVNNLEAAKMLFFEFLICYEYIENVWDGDLGLFGDNIKKAKTKHTASWDLLTPEKKYLILFEELGELVMAYLDKDEEQYKEELGDVWACLYRWESGE